jgi:hypothetical protein
VVPLASITLRPRHGIRAVLELRTSKSRVAVGEKERLAL